jgi:hypothetical protein
VNGLQDFRNNAFFTSSQRTLRLRAQVEQESGEYKEGSLSVVVEDVGEPMAGVEWRL